MNAIAAFPRAAVVLCSYHGERHLPAQLHSLRLQRRQPEVYVLSDDASTDASFAMLQAFAEERRAAGCAVVLHRNPRNLGYVRHFEQALARADAEVLFPCDQDDVWHPGKLERMLAKFAARPRLLALHADARLVDGEGEDLHRRLFEVLEVTRKELDAMHAGNAFAVLLRRNIVTGATMALRREVLAQALPVADHWSHDEWLALIASMHGEVDTLDEVLIDYRQHGGNQIGVREKQGLQGVGIGLARRAFMQRAAARIAGLSSHVSAQAAAREPASRQQAAIEQRRLHAQARAQLSAHWSRRIGPVFAEWRSGRYARFGHGLRSALVDLFGID